MPGLAGVSLADVSAEGAAGPAPALSCGGTTTTPPTSSTTTTTTAPTETTTTTWAPVTTTTALGVTVPGGTGSTGGTTPANLATTGSELGPWAGIAALLLLAGTAALVLARRRTPLTTNPTVTTSLEDKS